MHASDEHITFEILDEKFSVRSDVPKEYFLGLVSNLKIKIHSLKSKYPTLSSVRLMILAALDLADELSGGEKPARNGEQVARISALSDSLASVIEDGKGVT
jgi:cell division protein ZapA (FtsZ GTPase activity inhibitor)